MATRSQTITDEELASFERLGGADKIQPHELQKLVAAINLRRGTTTKPKDVRKDIKTALEYRRTAVGKELYDATQKGDVEEAERVLDANPWAIANLGSINWQYPTDGWTALIDAAWNGRHEIVELLLVKGADATLENTTGYTALAMAKEEEALQKDKSGTIVSMLEAVQAVDL